MTFRVLQVMAGAQKGGAETAFIDTVLALHECGVIQHVVTRPNDSRNARLIGCRDCRDDITVWRYL
jgi:hypothetical protein